MTELWGLAYDFGLLIARRLAEMPTEEGIRLAIEMESKTINPDYRNREEFDAYVRREAAFLRMPVEEVIRSRISGAVTHKVHREFEEFIGYNKEWDTKKMAEKALSYLRTNKVPFIFKVFKNITDAKFVEEELKRTNSRIGKLKEPIITIWAIPDSEEDPPIEHESQDLTGALLVVGLLAAIPVAWILLTLGLNGRS
jgi:hypothetical protein